MGQVKIIELAAVQARKTTIVRKIGEIVSDFVYSRDSYYKSAEYMSNINITAFN